MSSQRDVALSEQELADLDEFLLSDACGEETLTIDEIHGFLTAIIVGPDPAGPEEWLSAVWGQPRFADAAEEQRMTGLLLRMYDEIGATLRDRRPFEPLVIEEEENGEMFEIYEGWCFGFMLGVEQRQSAWEGLPRDEQALVAPMAQLALLVGEEEPEMDEEEYASWVELLPGAVAGLYAFWHCTH